MGLKMLSDFDDLMKIIGIKEPEQRVIIEKNNDSESRHKIEYVFLKINMEMIDNCVLEKLK